MPEYGMQRISYVVVLSLGNIAFDPSGSHANVFASCLSCVSCLAPTVGLEDDFFKLFFMCLAV